MKFRKTVKSEKICLVTFKNDDTLWNKATDVMVNNHKKSECLMKDTLKNLRQAGNR